MSYLQYLENKQHCTGSLPLAYYPVNRNHPLYNMPLHWHKETELLLVRSGEFLLSINGTEYPLGQGELCYIPEGCVHGGTPVECVYECIDFDLNNTLFQVPIVRDMLNKVNAQNRTIFPKFTRDQPQILNCAERLFHSIRDSRKGWELMVLSGLLELYGIVLQQGYFDSSVGKSASYQKVFQFKSVLEYIDDHYSQPITLDCLSRLAGMCPKYFCRTFREVIHRTPIDYLNAFRIEKACDLLSAGQHSITEVAYLCGFNDSCYFARCFKKYKSTTPKRYMSAVGNAASEGFENMRAD